MIHHPIEWGLEIPSQDTREFITYYGVNSKQQTFLLKLKWEPNKRQMKANLTIDDGKGTVYEFMRTKTGISLNENVYQLDGLRVEICDHLEKIGLQFMGFISSKSETGDKTVYMRLNTWFLPMSQVFDYSTDFNMILSAQETSRCNGSHLLSEIIIENSYEQKGQIKGTLKVDEETEEEIHLLGSRFKRTDCQEDDIDLKVTRFCGFSEKGHAFTVSTKSNRDKSETRSGCLQLETGSVYPLFSLSNGYAGLGTAPHEADTFHFTLSGGGQDLEVKGHRIRNRKQQFEVEFNGYKGMALIIDENISSQSLPPIK
jgi:hypothetical protein